MKDVDLTIIGGGLAGTEAAWQAARQGLTVRLFEMRPGRTTGAHITTGLAELVCSNSLGSNLSDRASGVLKNELRSLNSLLVSCAEATAVPAGNALAVDRDAFSDLVTRRLEDLPNIEIVRSEITEIPQGLAIIASGPLTSEALSRAIVAFSGENALFFYDAIAPIISVGSVNMEVAYRASRYDSGTRADGDYINCPLNKQQYKDFVNALISADRIPLHDFEMDIEKGINAGQYFEGCLPVEIIASRNEKSLAFGPMRPTGLTDPHTGRWPHALIQLRQDNLSGSLYNLVGFQTNLTYAEQKRIFHMIPGLEQAEFVRYGQMHRNTFLAAPQILLPTLQSRSRADLFFAGQITGVEGYMGNIATGLIAGVNAARLRMGRTPLTFPTSTMIGALCHYITHADMKDFQPMKAIFGILPPLETPKHIDRRERATLFSQRASASLEAFMRNSEREIDYAQV